MNVDYSKKSTIELIGLFQSKARVNYETTQHRASKIFEVLRERINIQRPGNSLTDDKRLSIAWGHSCIGEGPEELDELCKELKEYYSQSKK